MKKIEIEFRNRSKHWKSHGGKISAKKKYDTAVLIINNIKKNRDAINSLDSISRKDIRDYFERMIKNNRADSTIYDHVQVIKKIWKDTLNNSKELRFSDNTNAAITRRLDSISTTKLKIRTVEDIDNEIFLLRKKIRSLEREKCEALLSN